MKDGRRKGKRQFGETEKIILEMEERETMKGFRNGRGYRLSLCKGSAYSRETDRQDRQIDRETYGRTERQIYRQMLSIKGKQKSK